MKSASTKEFLTTWLPNQLALKMCDARVQGIYRAQRLPLAGTVDRSW